MAFTMNTDVKASTCTKLEAIEDCIRSYLESKPNQGSIITEPDPAVRATYHQYVRTNYPDLVLRTKYIPGPAEYVQCGSYCNCKENYCGSCYKWTSTEGNWNGCCVDDYSGCTSTIRVVRCSHCHSNVRYDSEVTKTRHNWVSSGEMLLCHKGTPYKHLGNYRKHYRTLHRT